MYTELLFTDVPATECYSGICNTEHLFNMTDFDPGKIGNRGSQKVAYVLIFTDLYNLCPMYTTYNTAKGETRYVPTFGNEVNERDYDIKLHDENGNIIQDKLNPSVGGNLYIKTNCGGNICPSTSDHKKSMAYIAAAMMYIRVIYDDALRASILQSDFFDQWVDYYNLHKHDFITEFTTIADRIKNKQGNKNPFLYNLPNNIIIKNDEEFNDTHEHYPCIDRYNILGLLSVINEPNVNLLDFVPQDFGPHHMLIVRPDMTLSTYLVNGSLFPPGNCYNFNLRNSRNIYMQKCDNQIAIKTSAYASRNRAFQREIKRLRDGEKPGLAPPTQEELDEITQKIEKIKAIKYQLSVMPSGDHEMQYGGNIDINFIKYQKYKLKYLNTKYKNFIK